MWWETAIIGLVVALAAGYLVRRWVRAAGGKQSACGCGQGDSCMAAKNLQPESCMKIFEHTE